MKVKYNRCQVMLHWLSAIIIIWALISGFYVALFDVNQQLKDMIGFFNVSITTVLIPFFVLRIIVMILSRHVIAKGVSAKDYKLAKIMHLLMYIIISVVLVSGVLMMDRPVSVFGAISFPQLLIVPFALDLWFVIHKYSCIVLLLLVVLHILSVIKHHFNGNKILKK